jgi:serine/threonine-protein kinase
MFLDEARIATRVHHTNVASVLDLVALEGELFLIMEYVEGESLARRMRGVRAAGGLLTPRIVGSVVSGAR